MKILSFSSLVKTFAVLMGANVCFVFSACGGRTEKSDNEIVLNMGHFPNVTHIQALVAHNLSRQGKGWFEERLQKRFNKPVTINWYVYNAGPSAMEAIFARSIDLAYVGPSPAINAYAKSKGKEIRLLSGSVEGGAALIVPKDSTLVKPDDFRDKVLATPQLGNTQDVSCRAWLTKGGLKVTQAGGDAKILPTANPEQLSLFRQNKLDGVWTVEPWVSRLEMEAQGKPVVEEKETVTTVLASSVDFLKQYPEWADAVVEAHHELTDWINANPEEARRMVVAELEALTRSKIDPALVENAWKRITVTNDLPLSKLVDFVRDAHSAGFLPDEPDVKGLIVLPPYSAANEE